jgi:hypothetical protein
VSPTRKTPFDGIIIIIYLIVTPIVFLLFIAVLFFMKKLGVDKDIIETTAHLTGPVIVILTLIFFFIGAVKKILNDNRMI